MCSTPVSVAGKLFYLVFYLVCSIIVSYLHIILITIMRITSSKVMRCKAGWSFSTQEMPILNRTHNSIFVIEINVWKFFHGTRLTTVGQLKLCSSK